MLSGASKTCGAVALVCVGLHAGAEGLHGVPLNDAELADTWGQALLNLTNTSVNDLDFTRITLAADIRINANLGNIRLGEYSYSANNGTGADIDISQLNFGGAGSVASKSTVLITDPYMEFVYRNAGNAATREVVGMRLGFGGIAGNVGVQFNSVSGCLLVRDHVHHAVASVGRDGGRQQWREPGLLYLGSQVGRDLSRHGNGAGEHRPIGFLDELA